MPHVQTITIMRNGDMITVQGALSSANVTSTGILACGVRHGHYLCIHVNLWGTECSHLRGKYACFVSWIKEVNEPEQVVLLPSCFTYFALCMWSHLP